jgi:hypothetical protein
MNDTLNAKHHCSVCLENNEPFILTDCCNQNIHEMCYVEWMIGFIRDTRDYSDFITCPFCREYHIIPDIITMEAFLYNVSLMHLSIRKRNTVKELVKDCWGKSYKEQSNRNTFSKMFEYIIISLLKYKKCLILF